MQLEILWEDPHGLAINKPAGLLTHPAQGSSTEPTLDALIRAYLRPDDPQAVYLGTIHRLDRPVSGVILWAKTPKAARRWSDQFAQRRTRKEYWAVVEQSNDQQVLGLARWDDWLSSPDRSGQARVVPAETAGAVHAITEVHQADLVEPFTDPRLTWLILKPETGRTHQLRAQAAARGWPIVGDVTYGARTWDHQAIALHARRLSIEHPIQRTNLTIEAPLPPSWSPWKLGKSS